MVKDIVFEYPFFKQDNAKITIQQGENVYVFLHKENLSFLFFFLSVVFGISGTVFLFIYMLDNVSTSELYFSGSDLILGIMLIAFCVLFTYLLAWISYNISILSGFPWESNKLSSSETIMLVNQNVNRSIFRFMNSSYIFRFLDVFPLQNFVVQFHKGYGSVISTPKGLEFIFEYSKKDKLLKNYDFKEKTLIVRDININQVIYTLSGPKNSTAVAIFHQDIDKMTNLLMIALTSLMIMNQWTEYPDS